MPIPAPEEEEFVSLEEAELAMRCFARENGFALSRDTLKYDKRKENIRRRDLRCSKGRGKRGHGVLRETATRMTQCPFNLRIKRTGFSA